MKGIEVVFVFQDEEEDDLEYIEEYWTPAEPYYAQEPPITWVKDNF